MEAQPGKPPRKIRRLLRNQQVVRLALLALAGALAIGGLAGAPFAAPAAPADRACAGAYSHPCPHSRA